MFLSRHVRQKEGRPVVGSRLQAVLNACFDSVPPIPCGQEQGVLVVSVSLRT